MSNIIDKLENKQWLREVFNLLRIYCFIRTQNLKKLQTDRLVIIISNHFTMIVLVHFAGEGKKYKKVKSAYKLGGPSGRH